MMKKFKIAVMSMALMFGLVGIAALPASAALCNGTPKDCLNKGVNKIDDGTDGDKLASLIKNVVNVLLFIVGVAAVIMIIIGGLRYVTSSGDSSQVTAAKNTVLYSVVGLVVAALAYAIVNFVVDKL